MFIIMGGTGGVGGATAEALLRDGERVTIVTRHSDGPTAETWRSRGAVVAEADAGRPDELRAVFRTGHRALLLNPPGDPTGDVDETEARTVDSILTALRGSGLEKVVAVSTYGARRGTRIGDLGTLWRLEAGLTRQPIPAAVNRGAYYLTNWDGLVDTVRAEGVLPSMLPAELLLPMVDPIDVGEVAAERLRSPADDVGIVHVEGPERHTPSDVADAFAAALGRPVEVRATPLDEVERAFAGVGFSPAAAASYAGMTRLTIASPDLPEAPRRGTTTVQQHIRALVHRAA